MFVRKMLVVLGLSFLAIIAVFAFNTWKYGKSQSFQIPPKLEVSIDIDGASQRLSEIVQVRTISYSVDAPVEKEAFLKPHSYFQTSFPKIDVQLSGKLFRIPTYYSYKRSTNRVTTSRNNVSSVGPSGGKNLRGTARGPVWVMKFCVC